MLLHSLFEPGLWHNGPVHVAFMVGGGTAILSSIIGIFTILRGNTFAGHALSDISGVGGSASFLFGVNPFVGFIIMGLLGAIGIEVAASRKGTDRSIATGIALGAGLALSALFLYFDGQIHSTTGTTFTVMFGSMWTISPALIPWALGMGGLSFLTILLFYRPLLLTCVDSDLARTRGIRVKWINLVYLMALALSTALCALTIGAILSTALLIGPAAMALHLTRHPMKAMLLACILGVVAVGLGIILAYDSFYWTPGHGWPVSFFIVALIFIAYLVIVHIPDTIHQLSSRIFKSHRLDRCES